MFVKFIVLFKYIVVELIIWGIKYIIIGWIGSVDVFLYKWVLCLCVFCSYYYNIIIRSVYIWFKGYSLFVLLGFDFILSLLKFE